jgi:hypothetical protein
MIGWKNYPHLLIAGPGYAPFPNFVEPFALGGEKEKK